MSGSDTNGAPAGASSQGPGVLQSAGPDRFDTSAGEGAAGFTVDGLRYDGRTPDGTPVTLTVHGNTVDVVAGGATGHFSRRDIRVDAAVPGVPRRLHLPDGAMIELEDARAIAAGWPAVRGIQSIADALERRWSATLLAGVVGALALWLVIGKAMPQAAAPVARHLDPAVERVVGERTLATLDRLVAGPSRLDGARKAHVAALVDAFMMGEPDAADYRLEFRGMGGPNAFALPGGIIVVADEMVRFAATDDELMAVLAHEIGHLREHHAVRLVLQQSGVAVLATLVAGDAVGMTFLAAAVPAMLLDAHYSRDFEREADAHAFAQLERHGRSPQAFADVMRRFAADRRTRAPDDPLLRYLSTHPDTEARIRAAEDAARARR
jgi:Zn-dependent protease with chaperone function